jgi:hypothetical protein
MQILLQRLFCSDLEEDRLNQQLVQLEVLQMFANPRTMSANRQVVSIRNHLVVCYQQHHRNRQSASAPKESASLMPSSTFFARPIHTWKMDRDVSYANISDDSPRRTSGSHHWRWIVLIFSSLFALVVTVFGLVAGLTGGYKPLVVERRGLAEEVNGLVPKCMSSDQPIYGVFTLTIIKSRFATDSFGMTPLMHHLSLWKIWQKTKSRTCSIIGRL